jgi:cysteinyl-tRNA synthetase
MSKSLGNFFTIREILEQADALALRHYFLSSHYRSPMDFSPEGLEEAGKATDRLYETLDRVERGQRQSIDAAEPGLMDAFRQEMDDDFNTPRALALIFDEVRALNRLLDQKKPQGLEGRAAALRSMCDALGLAHEGYFERKKQRFLNKGLVSLHEIEELISRRDTARKAKNWLEADRIRQALQEKGVVIEDAPGGTVWKVK